MAQTVLAVEAGLCSSRWRCAVAAQQPAHNDALAKTSPPCLPPPPPPVKRILPLPSSASPLPAPGPRLPPTHSPTRHSSSRQADSVQKSIDAFVARHNGSKKSPMRCPQLQLPMCLV